MWPRSNLHSCPEISGDPYKWLRLSCRRLRLATPRRAFRRSGTDGSNPVPSSGESVSLPELLSRVENPGFPRGCARLAWRPGRQRRAGWVKIAPSGGKISVAPYSSTAVPLMGLARMPRPHKVGTFAEFDCAVDRCARTGLNQSPARSADRARQATGVSARGASLASDRAAAAH